MYKKPNIDPLSREVLYILRSKLAYQRLFERLNSKLKRIGRSEMVDDLLALRAINNELLVRLSKFFDRSDQAHSIFFAIKSSNLTNKDELINQAEQLRLQLKPYFKVRNKTIAHLEKGHKDIWDESVNIDPFIEVVVHFLDKVNDAPISYTWKEGAGIEVDLRKELSVDD